MARREFAKGQPVELKGASRPTYGYVVGYDPDGSVMVRWIDSHGAVSGASPANLRAVPRHWLPQQTPNAKSKVSDKLNVDDIAGLFGLPDWDSIYEANIDGMIGEAGSYAYKDALNGGASEEDAEEADMKAQQEAESELFGEWHGAVTGAADKLFEVHGLTLVPVKAKGGSKYPYEYRVVPEKSWDDAARGIIDTINGVGMFRFDTLREFLDSGPYTARTGVLTHLHHIASYPEVYGTTSARRMYEGSFR